MRVRVIANPVASSMTPRRLHLVEAGLRAAHDVDTALTGGRDDARGLARRAAEEGVEVVVVAAGDGTLSEAADGLVGTATALAPLPGGSTNVFARASGFGNRMNRALDRLVRALAADSIARVGVGAANGRHFLFHLGAGFDAAVVERIERAPRVKRYAAHPAFALATLRLVAGGFDRRHPRVRVRLPDGEAHDSFLTVVSNVAPYTFVGFRRMLLTREASLCRALALTSITRFRLADIARAVGSALCSAGYLSHCATVVQRADLTALRLEATSADGFPWQVDGDFLGTAHALEVRYVPDALWLVLPPGGPGPDRRTPGS